MKPETFFYRSLLTVSSVLLSFCKTAVCQLSNSSLVIEKCLIKCQYFAVLKYNENTLWERSWGLLSFSHWCWWVLSSAVQPDSLCQRVSQTLQVKRWVWTVSGLWLHSVQKHRFSLRAPAYARTNPSSEAAGKANVWLSLDEMSRGQVYVLTFLQLSVNPAVACTAPVWSPTNASAKKAGTGDTAIKVSEKQTLRVLSEVLHTWCYAEMTPSRALPALLMILCSFFSNL